MDGTDPFRVCPRGHRYRRDENYTSRRGRCPECGRASQRKYRATQKGQEARLRHNLSDKARERQRRNNARTNPARIMAGGSYVGYCAFSVTETEAMLNGSSD